ncbi:hypothetical protein CVIRNUC_010829 [Coccomyxa viridis]|uniref:Uncharacterized protein n=1 Tax=Coccomyxa viridis TaxID=1274662 RepID=A0AAV1IK01_9CHLO|nr:hypothetical protein CVIRNUC_010829 [Coccomyxa viridis]
MLCCYRHPPSALATCLTHDEIQSPAFTFSILCSPAMCTRALTDTDMYSLQRALTHTSRCKCHMQGASAPEQCIAADCKNPSLNSICSTGNAGTLDRNSVACTGMHF